MEQISGAAGQPENSLPLVVQRLFPFYCNKTPEKPSAFSKASSCNEGLCRGSPRRHGGPRVTRRKRETDQDLRDDRIIRMGDARKAADGKDMDLRDRGLKDRVFRGSGLNPILWILRRRIGIAPAYAYYACINRSAAYPQGRVSTLPLLFSVSLRTLCVSVVNLLPVSKEKARQYVPG